MPAELPLGPWLEQRESTLCNTPGGYEEQMSCLLPSSSRLKAAHTSPRSRRRTGWKEEPLKAPRLVVCVSIFGRWLAVFEEESLFAAGLLCCSAHRAPSGQRRQDGLWMMASAVSTGVKLESLAKKSNIENMANYVGLQVHTSWIYGKVLQIQKHDPQT